MKNGLYLQGWARGGFRILYVNNNTVYNVDTRHQRVVLREGQDIDLDEQPSEWWQRWTIDFNDFKAKLMEAIGAVDDPFAWEKPPTEDGRGFIRLGSHLELARLKLKIPKKGSRRKP